LVEPSCVIYSSTYHNHNAYHSTYHNHSNEGNNRSLGANYNIHTACSKICDAYDSFFGRKSDRTFFLLFYYSY